MATRIQKELFPDAIVELRLRMFRFTHATTTTWQALGAECDDPPIRSRRDAKWITTSALRLLEMKAMAGGVVQFLTRFTNVQYLKFST